MKKTLIALAACLAATSAYAADPVVGKYRSLADKNGISYNVQLNECGAKICGLITKAFDGSGAAVASDAIGKKMMWDMEPKGNGSYGGGKIFAPDTGKTYNSKMQIKGNSLKVSGCIGPICRGQTWSPVN